MLSSLIQYFPHAMDGESFTMAKSIKSKLLIWDEWKEPRGLVARKKYDLYEQMMLSSRILIWNWNLALNWNENQYLTILELMQIVVIGVIIGGRHIVLPII